MNNSELQEGLIEVHVTASYLTATIASRAFLYDEIRHRSVNVDIPPKYVPGQVEAAIRAHRSLANYGVDLTPNSLKRG
jgi:hypothetical protein